MAQSIIIKMSLSTIFVLRLVLQSNSVDLQSFLFPIKNLNKKIIFLSNIRLKGIKLKKKTFKLHGFKTQKDNFK